MTPIDFDSFSKDELLELEDACDAFEQDLHAGQIKATKEYLKTSNTKLLELAELEFQKIRDGEKIHSKTQPGLPAALQTLGGDDEDWGNFAEGQLIDRFRLIRLLGLGATSQVWRAHDISLSRDVAIKFPQANRSGILKRFSRESKAVAKLRHPNIVSIYEVNLDYETPYLVCDLIEGESLAERMEHRKYSLAESVDLMIQIADAVAYSHQQDVLHRDLKPQNILVDEKEMPYVTDFGLARILESDSELLTQEGDMLGTPAYMSPEQACGKASVDQRSDVYSLGVMLFQLLTGDLPFRGNIQSIVHQILYSEPLSPRVWNAEISRDLETICLKCLAKNSNGRFQSASELSEELKRIRDGEPIKSRPVSRFKKFRLWVGRNRFAAASTGLVCLLLVGMAVGGLMFGLAFSNAHRKQIRLRLAAEASKKEAVTSRKEKEKALQDALQQKSIAEQKAQDAESAFQFLGSVFQQSEPVLSVLTGDGIGAGDPPTLENIFRNAAKRLESRFPGDGAAQAKLLDILGNSCRSLGLFKVANELLESAEKTRLENIHSIDAAELGFQVQQHEFFVGQLLQDLGELQKAEEHFLVSCRNSNSSRESKLIQASVDFQLGKLYLTIGENEKARNRFTSCVEVRERLLSKDSHTLKAALIGLELCNGFDGDMKSLSKIRKLIGKNGWPARAAQLYVAALVSRHQKDLKVAVGKYRELIGFLRKILSDKHPLYVMAMGEFAGLLWEFGDYREALSVAEYAIGQGERMSPNHYLLDRAKLKLAQEFHRNGQHAKAIPILERLLEKNPKAGVKFEIFESLIWSYRATGQNGHAQKIADKFLEFAGQMSNEVSAWIYHSAARVYQQIDARKSAEFDKKAKDAFRERKRLPGSGFWSRRMAIVCLFHDELTLAEKYIRQALKLEVKRFHEEHPRVANCKMTLAEILIRQNKAEEARAEINSALRIRVESLPSDSSLIQECKNLLAKAKG